MPKKYNWKKGKKTFSGQYVKMLSKFTAFRYRCEVTLVPNSDLALSVRNGLYNRFGTNVPWVNGTRVIQ